MQAGDIVGDRFAIERAVSAGGMGVVYLARDLREGGAVAIKTMTGASEAGVRFQREVEILAGLRHPGVVRYVAHGMLPEGSPFLAMEWVEGSTLASRINAGPLSIADGITLGARLGGALGAFHRRGGVHRDLKPDNVILAGGVVEGATLIDFGVARLSDRAGDLTAPGMMVGTPRYMAPEQVRGHEHVDARADVFSLGCVLFRCLTGENAFGGAADDLSVLLKVLLEDVPLLRSRRPDAPAWLEALLAAMLEKAPGARPPDGGAVAEALLASAPPRAQGEGAPRELTARERRVLCLLLTADPTGTSTLGDVIRRHRGRAEVLPDRSLLGVFAGAGTATDLAAQAARCGLEIASRVHSPIVVVTGRAALTASLPVGDLIDRAVARLGSPAGSGIRLDDVTAGLLGPGFEVGAGEGGRVLLAERAVPEAPRTLLGKPTPCVGRDRELARLEDAVVRCAEDGEARAVLVTGPAGAGKSRVVHELLQRIGADREVWLGRGDPVSAGSPFALLGQALRRAAGVLDGEPLASRQKKIRARFGQRFADGGAGVVELVGELCGAPFPDDRNGKLRAARRDPMVMGIQMRAAFEELIRAECQARPVVLVLEDLHWGDGPTVRFVDAALRNARMVPFFVLAAARPEVRDTFPRLWCDHALDEMPLRPLTRRASEELVRGALGGEVDADIVRGLAEQADGNAFYLEELIRAVAEGRSSELPETVLAVAEARLSALDPEARRILRAASIFGRRFWRGGVIALLGAAPVDDWLAALSAHEVISPAPEARFPGEVEYVFRHALVRDAAYGMLTAEDCAVGHRLAGAWLEAAGEGDAMVLAECFERGGELGKAALWYRRAAEHAFEGNDLDLAVARAERAVACAGQEDGVWLGRMHLLAAQANRWRGQHKEALASAREAVRLLPRASAPWWEALAEAATAANIVPAPAELDAASEEMLAAETGAAVGPGASPDEVAVACAVSLARAAIANFYGGCYARGERLLSLCRDLAQRASGDPEVAAHVDCARGIGALVKGDGSSYLALMRNAGASFEQAGDLRSACVQTLRVGDAYLQLGGYGAAERAFRGTLREAERLALPGQRAAAKINLGLSLALQGKIEEGIAAEEEGLAMAEGDQRFVLTARIYLARILVPVDPSRAAREILPVAGTPDTPAAYRSYALAVLAAARLALGLPDEALPASRLAVELLATLGEIEEGAAFIHLVHVEALEAKGEIDAARTHAATARARILDQAAKIADRALCHSFLEHVPENARTLDLAGRLLESGPPA